MGRGYRLAAMIFLIITIMALNAYATGEQPRCELQPSGVELTPNGESKILWVFDTPQDEWYLLGGPGSFVEGFSWGHCGDDYYANDWVRNDGNQEGQQVYAGISGMVYTREFPNTWGKEVIIYNSDYKFALRYAHLSSYDESINGKWVSATSNTPIGKVGSSGLGTGPHLHLVLYKNVDSIDEGNPVRYSSCSVANGECAKSATNHAAQFSFNPRSTKQSQSSPFIVPTSVNANDYIHALEDKNSEVRRSAAETLGKLKDTRAIEPLTQALKDGDSEVRRAATDALDNLKTQTRREADNDVQMMLRRILENLGMPQKWINLLMP